MEYVRLGRTGLQVSRICLGCMSYGQPETPGVLHREWTLNEQDSRPFFKRALELGVNFFDTANAWARTTSISIGSTASITKRRSRKRSRRSTMLFALARPAILVRHPCMRGNS